MSPVVEFTGNFSMQLATLECHREILVFFFQFFLPSEFESYRSIKWLRISFCKVRACTSASCIVILVGSLLHVKFTTYISIEWTILYIEYRQIKVLLNSIASKFHNFFFSMYHTEIVHNLFNYLLFKKLLSSWFYVLIMHG